MIIALTLTLLTAADPWQECGLYRTGSPCHDVLDLLPLCDESPDADACALAVAELFQADASATRTALRLHARGCEDDVSMAGCGRLYDACDNAIGVEGCAFAEGDVTGCLHAGGDEFVCEALVPE
jgi:hypothetical protein